MVGEVTSNGGSSEIEQSARPMVAADVSEANRRGLSAVLGAGDGADTDYGYGQPVQQSGSPLVLPEHAGEVVTPDQISRRDFVSSAAALFAGLMAAGLVTPEEAEATLRLPEDRLRAEIEALAKKNKLIKSVAGAMLWADAYTGSRVGETKTEAYERLKRSQEKLQPLHMGEDSLHTFSRSGLKSEAAFWMFKTRGKISIRGKDGRVSQDHMHYVVASDDNAEGPDNSLGLRLSYPIGSDREKAEQYYDAFRKRV